LIDDDSELLQWLYMLLAPGSSLGGARVRDSDGSLWIAKFPSREDKTDVGAWEMIANELAQMAGLKVAQAMAKTFYSKRHTFLTKRFDRTVTGKRLHFASAMTLLGYKDGISFQDGVSYNSLDLDLAVEVTSFFRLIDIQAGDIIRNTVEVVSGWKQLAQKYRISNEEQERISPAFRHCELAKQSR